MTTELVWPTAKDVIEHYKEVNEEQTSFLLAHQAELLEIAEFGPNLAPVTNVHYAINDLVQKQKLNAYSESFQCPTVISRFLCYIWGDIAELRGPDKAKAPSTRAQAVGISDLILPRAGVYYAPNQAGMQFEAYDPEYVAACSKAELFFYDAYRQVMSRQYQGQNKISVIHDENASPIAFQKSDEVRTAITLRPLKVEGAYIPTATIIKVRKNIGQTQTGVKKFKDFELRTYQAEDSLMLRPVRLTPWSFKEYLSRAHHALSEGLSGSFDVKMDRLNTIYSLSAESFNCAAHEVMRLCRVTVQEAA